MRLVAGCLVKFNDKYLLVQERLPKAYGLWNLPAGHVDQNETLAQAAIRECKEETGLEVTLGSELCTMNDGYAEIHIFEAFTSSDVLNWSRDELLNADWFNKEEILKLKLREESFAGLFS